MNPVFLIATLMALFPGTPFLQGGLALPVSQVHNQTDSTLFIYRFQEDTAYTYEIVLVRQEGSTDEVFYSVLRKNKMKVDSLLLGVNYPLQGTESFFTTNVLKGFLPSTAIKGIDELGILTNKGLGEIYDGYVITQMLFGRSGDKLVKELLIVSEGGCYSFEPYSSGFTNSEFILPGDKGGRKGKLIVETISEETNEIKGKNKTTRYYTDAKVYRFNGREFIADKNGLDSDYYFVTAKTGLNVRMEPFAPSGSDSLSRDPVLGRLNYGDSVQAIRRTDIKHKENGKTGYWVEIVYTEPGRQTAFVFSGYLSKNKP